MAEVSAEWGEIISILIMAFALGLDAFSLGIGIGMRGIRLLHILKISVTVACFHILMPLIGVMMGQYAGLLLGHIASYVGGLLLLVLGIHMIFNSFRSEAKNQFDCSTMLGVIVFALSVSIDSLSVGISLGLFSSNLAITVLLFGTAGGIMSIFGLLFGRRLGQWIGSYGEAFGGVILLAFGIRFLL